MKKKNSPKPKKKHVGPSKRAAKSSDKKFGEFYNKNVRYHFNNRPPCLVIVNQKDKTIIDRNMFQGPTPVNIET